ncbi:MAG TPA: tRNA 2-thiouridine(34) synthase MnmA [Solirubrobacteraceae bacterium]|nr:tRNA 2-thiouridine(34) synthase MnmA [Solirubrobacteraceae bacterium]
MADERFEEHLLHPEGRGDRPTGARDGVAGGAACGDLVRVSLRVEGDRVAAAGFDASGCGAAIAAGSAATSLARGRSLLDAARIGTADVAAELGGLSPGKLHAAELAADALARALGEAARRDASLATAVGLRKGRVRDETQPSAPAGGGERVLVAMSGGVDSSVAALLEARRGAEVVAVTLELWRDPANDAEASCCSASAVRAARALAHSLDLPHLTLDLREEFRAGVVEPWLAEHAAGRTPNPCVRCNGSVRLDAMLDLARRLGADALATGHYARTTPDGLLRAAADESKDQSYMLAALAPESIARLRFPLGEMQKQQVRAIAREAGLPTAGRPDSQDLCFLAGTGRAAFLARHGGLGERPGEVRDRAGRALGRHRGAHHYTVGQRRGLGVGGSGEPLYVLRTDTATNTVTVGPRAALDGREIALRDLRLHRPADEVDGVRLRYRSPPLPCALDGDTARLERPFAGAAPGQAAVLLSGDVVVGVATIDGSG